MRKLSAVVIVVVLVLANVSWATGMLIPKDKTIPPLAIKHQRVDVKISDQVAETRVEQVFQNSVNRDLEATYIFPLPKNASISDFALYINGKRTSAELIEAKKARKIYEDIVRRMRDPGLLEYMGNNLFKIRVYPVPRNGQQRIELTYSEALKMDSGVCQYVYPLRTGEKASATLDDFSVSVSLTSKVPIKTIYSPSHQVGIQKKDDHNAVIGFEEERSVLNKDFLLYYTVSEKDFGINLLTHRVKGKDGFFMLMISPKTELKEGEILAKDITFVIDTSGSMSGAKMEQARNALKYCVKNLNEKDRFNIVRFSTDVGSFDKGLVAASKENVKRAIEFIEAMEARGGTNINDALQQALAAKADEARPYTVVFLTDGKPTVGETNIGAIVDNVKKSNKASTRVFVFGVGFKVNTHLLDKIAETTRGYPEYVTPNEDIEVKVSSFYNKASQPVLSNLALDFGTIKVSDTYPKALPDLFKGSQLTLFGRYKGNGSTAVKLTGEVNGEKKKFVHDGEFDETNVGNDFIDDLWATRKVGYLLDEIRLHGENKELVDEVVRLSKEYGIATPYTSYLVVEDQKAYVRARRRGRGGRPFGRFAALPMAQQAEAKARSHALRKSREVPRSEAAAVYKVEKGDILNEIAERNSFWGDGKVRAKRESRSSRQGGNRRGADREEEVFGLSAVGMKDGDLPVQQPSAAMKLAEGEKAVRLSRAIEKLKQSQVDKSRAAAMKRVNDHDFFLMYGVWVDSQYKEGLKETKIKYASEAYFDLLTAKPEWKDFFKLGDTVIIVMGKKCLIIGDEGKEKLTEGELKEIVKNGG